MTIPLTAVTAIPRLWLDRPDALDWLDASHAKGQIADAHISAAYDLVQSGLAIVRNVANPALCDQVANDFSRYLHDHSRYAARCVDVQGRHLRFVNLHRASEAALELGNISQIMSLLDFLFGRPAAIYTSLLFEYGSHSLFTGILLFFIRSRSIIS